MTNTTLHSASLTQKVQNVLIALRELALATRQLAVAAFFRLAVYRQPPPPKTAQQEAEQLRAYADQICSSDPRFARDLYAAATRHEQAANTH